jgi:hypothetical protein
MTASGLRREGARGRLGIERIAGKDYTTLANIERMRELCRVPAKVPASTSGASADAGLLGVKAARSHFLKPLPGLMPGRSNVRGEL